MEETHGYRWLILVFFSTVGIAFMIMIFYLVLGSSDPDFYWKSRNQLDASSDSIQVISKQHYIISRNQQIHIDKLKIIYLGLIDEHIHLDVINTDVDSTYAYPYTISLRSAKQGFRLSDYRFMLVTGSKSKIKITKYE